MPEMAIRAAASSTPRTALSLKEIQPNETPSRAHQLGMLAQYHNPQDEKLWLSDIKESFVAMNEAQGEE
jgi:hypothetical protein